MTSRSRIIFAITCDAEAHGIKCPDRSIESADAHSARAIADAFGWITTDDGRDLCPHHGTRYEHGDRTFLP